jgi:galactoside O-acetyltransferase
MTRKDWVKVYEESLVELLPTTKLKDFYYSDDLKEMGIECGDNCLVHKTNTLINEKHLKLGNNVRIDGFCVISCGKGISIGSNVHIASHVVLMGGASIRIENYASIASGAKVYSVSDDVMGRGLVGPCVDNSKRYLHSNPIEIKEHSVLCVNSVMMPGSSLNTGTVLLPFSLLTKPTEKMKIYGGSPATIIKDRKETFLQKL